jgi:ABC-type nitrate/sulfonate/bicarbonate transport system ATPase subunit
MDAQAPDRQILLSEYKFLRQLNQATLAAAALAEVVSGRVPSGNGSPVALVDFGSGGADIPERCIDLLRRRGLAATCLCTDRSPESIAINEAAPRPGLSFRIVDVVRASESLVPKSFDVAHASLVLHHLSDADVVEALRQMAMVARHAIVWNDLVRDRIGVVGAWISTIGRRRELRRDAVVSVRRGFTIAEALALAEAAGICDLSVRRVRGARFVLCGRPPSSGEVMDASSGFGRPLARASDLGVRYGRRQVLRGLSLVARAGEVVLVGGPNGAGKSTLLACLAGALVPQTGSVWIDRTEGHPGYHPQEGGLFTSLTVARNLETFAELNGVPAATRARVIDAAIDRFGLRDHVAQPIAALSGGLRRRAAIAVSLLHEPKVVLLDEPDAGLDGAGRAVLVHEIRTVLDRRGSVIIASHTPVWLEELSAVTRRIGLEP